MDFAVPLLWERRCRRARLRLKAVGQIARRRNSDRNNLARVEALAFGAEQTEPREPVLVGNRRNHFILNGSIVDELRFADERGPGARTDPDQERAAPPEPFRLPAIAVRVDQNLAVWLCDKPHRRRGALTAVLAHSGDIDVARSG